MSNQIEKTKFYEIGLLLFKKRIPDYLRFLLFEKNNIIRVYKGFTYQSSSINEINSLGIKSFDRGDILEAFSKIEFLINEIIIVYIRGFNSMDEVLDDLLENIDLFTKTKILNKWERIDNQTKEKILKCREVRNGFAHKWSVEEIRYKDNPLKIVFPNFQQDLINVWKALILAYQKQLSSLDLDKLLGLLKKLPDREKQEKKKNQNPKEIKQKKNIF